MIQAVIFDYDGVVVNTEMAWDRSDTEFLLRHGVPKDQIDPDLFKSKLAGYSLVEGVKVFQDMFGITGEPVELAEERQKIAYEITKKEIQFTKGFLDFFKTLKHLKTCVATSCDPSVFKAGEENLKIEELFNNKIYYIRDVGYKSKPSPDIFIYSAKQLGIDPESCVVIEDSPNGIRAAKTAGMKCIALATTFDKALLSEADVVVDKFSDIDLNNL